MLLKEFEGKIMFSVSHTTRSIRHGETNGVHYHFINQKLFKDMIEKDEFVEYAIYNNNYYGTSKSELINKKSDKCILLIETDIAGTKKLNEFNLGFDFFGIVPPSMEILKDRLINRGSEDDISLERRLNIGLSEINEIKNCEFIKYRFVNDNLDQCYKEIKDVLIKLYSNIFDNKI